MNEYKSRKVKFFSNKKVIALGEYVTPTVVKLFSKLIRNEKIVGKGVEYLIVIMLFLSVLIYLA